MIHIDQGLLQVFMVLYKFVKLFTKRPMLDRRMRKMKLDGMFMKAV